MNDPTRFLDALHHIYLSDLKEAVARILVIGPGLYEAFDGLLALFPSAQITAVEADAKISEALSLKLHNFERVTVIVGDASALSDLAPGPYDLIIARHPDVARFPQGWMAALAASISHLNGGGKITVTAYSLAEISFLDHFLQTQPVLQMLGSPYTSVPVAFQGNDRYILTYERNSPSVS